MLCLETALGDGEAVRGRFTRSLLLGNWLDTLSESTLFSLRIRTSHCHFDFAFLDACLPHPHCSWSRPCFPQLRVGSILLHRKQRPGCSLLTAAWRARRHSRWPGTWDPWNAAIYLSRRHEKTGRGTGPPPRRQAQQPLLAHQVPRVPLGLELGLEVVVAAELVQVQQEGR